MEIEVTSEEFPQLACELLSKHERVIARFGGHLVALNHILEVLILTHPDVKSLHATWQANLPEILDEEATSALFDAKEYREGLQAELAAVSRFCERAAQRLQS